MENYICLDKKYSTTRRLFQENSPSAAVANKGGLRRRGLVKKSFFDCPLVTVIVTAGKGAKDVTKFEKTILSVLDQTYENIELIVIGNDQEMQDTLASYDDRIDFWVIEPELELFEAMNIGIEIVVDSEAFNSDWVNFQVAGDTFYEKETVQNVFSTEYGRPDIIYGHTYYLAGDRIGVVRAGEFNILWKAMIFSHQSIFARPEVLKNKKFNTKMRLCADYEFIVDSYMTGLTFFNSDVIISTHDPRFSEISCTRTVFEKWKIIKKYRSDFEFHQYYFALFFRRFFQDVSKKIGRMFKPRKK